VPGHMADSKCNVGLQITKADRDALREIAEREDRTVSWLVRQGVKAVLAEKRTASPAKETAPKQTRAGATCEPG
jgi:hypothetical protein